MVPYRAAISSLAVALFLAVAVGGANAAESRIPQDQITMNFQNVDIPVLAKFISEITGKNFIVDESVRGKVTIISPTKVTPEEAYQAFQSALQIKGFTTVQTGKTIKIIPSRNVRSDAPLTESQQPAETRGDEYVTRMVRLKNVDAASLVQVVQPMVSHDGLVAAYPEDNTLILTDDAYNVERLLKIIGTLDVQGMQKNVVVIPLKLAFAGELAPEIESIMGAREGGQGREGGPQHGPGVISQGTGVSSSGMGFKVIPDERTNSLIVLAGPLQMAQIQEIVSKLDIQPPNATSRIHVYRLKNAQALEMVQVLDSLISGGGSPSTLSPMTGKGSLGRGSALGMMGGGGFGGMGGMGGFGGGYGGYGGMGGFGGGSLGGGGFASGFGGIGSGMGGGMGMMRGGGGGFGGGGAYGGGTMGTSTGGGTGGAGGGNKNPDFASPVSITADPATNALVVSAAPQDWQTLKQIIDDLDVPRVQIFVQAIVVEVQAERARDIGVNFYGAAGGNPIGIGTLNFNQLQTALGNPLGMTGLGIGLSSGSQCTIPISTGGSTGPTPGTMKVPCDFALMTALETDTHANVLSAPTLLTADNEEAMIIVGQNLPFVGSSNATSALSGQVFNSIERQNVGITLDMVPQVAEGDYVKMDMYEEVSNVVNGSQDVTTNPNGPTTTIRSASTSVFVQNHRTAVIGGLLSSQDTIQNQGVPFISNIPVLGNLFSNRSSDKQKDNLIVFLTPHIVRTKEQLRALALDERQRYINSLGRKEMHDMPASQIHELYKPSFSIAVPPEADLGGTMSAPPPPAGAFSAPSPTGPSETPFNTEEIGPSSSSGSPAAPAARASTSPGIPVASSGSGPTAPSSDPK